MRRVIHHIYASLSNIYFSSFIYDCFYRTLHRQNALYAHRGRSRREIDYFPLSRPRLTFRGSRMGPEIDAGKEPGRKVNEPWDHIITHAPVTPHC